MEVPSYEEYQRATAFARFRYRFGFIVLVLCWLSLIYLICYMATNVEGLSANPLQYGCEKMKLECHCYRKGTTIDFYINATDRWLIEYDDVALEKLSRLNFSEIDISEFLD